MRLPSLGPGSWPRLCALFSPPLDRTLSTPPPPQRCAALADIDEEARIAAGESTLAIGQRTGTCVAQSSQAQTYLAYLAQAAPDAGRTLSSPCPRSARPPRAHPERPLTCVHTPPGDVPGAHSG